MAGKKKETKIVVLPGAPKLYAVSFGVAFNFTDFRLAFVNEIVETEQGKVAEIVGQVALAPIVTKRLSNLLATKIKEYEDKYGGIQEPKLKN